MIAAQRVCAVGDLAPAAAMAATVTGPDGEIALVVARDSDGTWHALDRMCTHGEVSLADGDVDGHAIECWGHGSLFDLSTGVPTLPATVPVHVFPVTLDGDDVLVAPVPVTQPTH